MTDETTPEPSASPAPATNIIDAPVAAPPAAPAPPFGFTFQQEAVDQVFGKAGEDGRPANVPAKYWDADKKALKTDVVFSQLKWAEGKLGKKVDLIGAPEKVDGYELKAAEGIELPFDATDPVVADILAFAKDEDLSPAFVNRLVNRFATAQMKAAGPEAQAARMAEEMKALGSDAPQRVKDLGDYIKTNLEPAQAEALKALVTDAASFQAVESLIASLKPPKFVDRGAAPASGGQPTKADWEKFHFATNERGDRLVAIDPEYRKRSEAMRDAVFGTTRRDASGRATA